MRSAEAQTVLAEIRATWPQRQIDEAQTVVWMDTLAPVPIDAARAAVKRLRQENDWMPTHHEFLVAAQAEGRRIAAHRAVDAAKGVACPECGGDDWVELGGERASFTVPTVRPCSRCLPLQFVRWQGRHFEGDHRCGECADLHSGSAADKKAARAAIVERHVPVDLDPLF